jgi:hypothetical protein
MGKPNLEEGCEQMDLGVCRIPPFLPRANRQTHESRADNNRPPGTLSGIAVVLVATGLPNLFSVTDLMAAVFLGDLQLIFYHMAAFGIGLLMVTSGWGLARLERWALSGAILSLTIFTLIALANTVLSTYWYLRNPVWAVVSIAMNLIMIIYLLRPDTRGKFE